MRSPAPPACSRPSRTVHRAASGAVVAFSLALVGCGGDDPLGPGAVGRTSDAPIATIVRTDFPDTHSYRIELRAEPDEAAGESGTWDPAWADDGRYELSATAWFESWNTGDPVPVQANIGGRASGESVNLVVRPKLGRIEIGGLRRHHVWYVIEVREILGG